MGMPENQSKALEWQERLRRFEISNLTVARFLRPRTRDGANVLVLAAEVCRYWCPVRDLGIGVHAGRHHRWPIGAAPVPGSERLTGAALDRLTHRCHILETKGESYRLQDAKRRRRALA
jgi:hypothetical protein